MLISFSINIFANQNNQLAFEYENMSVVFESGTIFSVTEREYIADMLVYGESDVTLVQPRAWCWLTGHDSKTEYVRIITHKKYALEPRCLEELFEVTTCSKCDLYDMVLVSSTAIICCEEE
jgi:hypothetical protein